MANDYSKEVQQAEAAIDKIIQKMLALDLEIQKINASLIKVTSTLVSATTASKGLGNTADQLKKMADTTDKLTASEKQADGERKKREGAIKKESDLRERLNRQKEKEQSQNFKNLRASTQAARQNEHLNRSFVKLTNQYKQAKNSLQDLITTGRKAGQTQAQYNKQLKTAQARFDKLTAKVNHARKAVSNFKNTGLGGLVRNARNLVAAFGIIGGATLFASAIKDAFKLTKTLDSLRFAMKAVITNNQEYAQTQEFLRQITQDYGAELVTVTNRYIKFRAATQQAGLTAKETQEIFGTMTKAAGVLGLKTDELQGIFLALEQMVSKGKITTEELRRQLGERLPGAMDIMANSLGVTTAQLDDMLKKGQVITAEVLPGFAKQVEIAFGLESVTKVETLQAATIRLKNAWTILVEEFNKGNNASGKLMVVFDFLAKNLGRIIKVGFAAVTMFAAYKTAIILANIQARLFAVSQKLIAKRAALVRLGMIKMAQGTTVFASRMKALNAVIRANALFLIISLLAGAWVLFKKFNKSLLETTKGINEVNKAFVEQAKATIKITDEVDLLIKRYDQLKNNTERTKDEQQELNNVIAKIGKLFPEVVTSVDKYGKALEINDEQTKRLLETTKELIKAKAIVKLEEESKLYERNTKKLKALNSEFGVMVKGVGEAFSTVVKTNEGVKVLVKTTSLGEKIMRDLSAAEKVTFLQWEQDTLKQIALTKQLQDELVDLVEQQVNPDPEGVRERLIKEQEQRLENILTQVKVVPNLRAELSRLETRLKRLTKDGYEKLTQSEVDNIIATRESIDLTKKKITEITGETFAINKATKAKTKNTAAIKENNEAVELVGEFGSVAFIRGQINHFETLSDRLKKNTIEWLENQTQLAYWRAEMVKVTAATDDQTEAIEKLAEAATEIGEWADDMQGKLDDVMKEFFQGFQDDFFSDTGFDKLNEMFFQLDENGKSVFDNLVANASTGFEKFAVHFNAITEVAQEVFAFLNQAQDAYFDREFERLEIQRDISIQFAGDSATAREEIERQYEDRRKIIQRRQARAQKEQAIFNTIINTAQGVVAALASVPPNVPLSIVIGAIGAAQVALISSTPVPEFFRGTMNAPEGWAKVDEKRPEIHTDRQGRIKSLGESKPNYRYLQSGDKIFKSHEHFVERELGTTLANYDINPNLAPVILQGLGTQPKNDDVVREIKNLKKTIQGKPSTIINMDQNGNRVYQTKNGQKRELLNNVLRLKSTQV